jgi:hypothetical protein
MPQCEVARELAPRADEPIVCGYRVTLIGDGTATYPAAGLTEEQIRDHVYRVAYGTVAEIEPASALFT